MLVGTTSIEKSEQLAEMLRKAGWEQHDFSDPNAFAALYSGDEGATKTKVFAILNARYHEQEAYIVSQAGVPGAITIATNMAGRGTDIQLGGNADMRIRQELADIEDWRERERDPRADEIRAQVARLKEKALAAGGLFVLGTERHESRRIDNQLRGRSGRQGDPGHSKFFLSLEDDLMRIFGSDKLDGMLQKLGLKENEAIVHPWINKALEKAQQKVEARNFDIRKNLLKFDNVMNDQRKVIFDQRVELMQRRERSPRPSPTCATTWSTTWSPSTFRRTPIPSSGTSPGLKEELQRVLGLDLPVDEWAKEEGIADEELLARIERRADEHMAAKVAQWGPEVMRYVEKSILLQTLDHLWREHLRDARASAPGDRPARLRPARSAQRVQGGSLQPVRGDDRAACARRSPRSSCGSRSCSSRRPSEPQQLALHGGAQARSDDRRGRDGAGRRVAGAGAAPATATATAARPSAIRTIPTTWGKVGRNEACPCGSGKKYKHCHGRFA